jgi:sulfate/thiosulfate transport system substrate-binding protein
MRSSLLGAANRRLQDLLPLLLLGSLLLYSVWPWLPLSRARLPRTLVFYGFSILGEAMQQSIFPDFATFWKDKTGEEVQFVSAFAGSGTVTHQLIMGVPAELALLSLELDAQRLADAGTTSADSWTGLPEAGVVNRTPFIILVRPGNPRHIQDFADLARSGVGVVHQDPLTSGGANWAVLAEYGSAMRRPGASPQDGHDLLLGIWRNVVAQASSARAARTQFENGFGDALITYEQEALSDRMQGRLHAEIVYPRSTVLSEHTMVVLERNVAADNSPLVQAFLAYLWSPRAQKLFVRHGFRSVLDPLNREAGAFGPIADPFYVSDFGGWRAVKQKIVDGIWRDQVLREIHS